MPVLPGIPETTLNGAMMLCRLRRCAIVADGARSRTLPQRSSRGISSYLRDVLRTGSLLPSNPVLDGIRGAGLMVSAASVEGDSSPLPPPSSFLPDFRHVEPRHAVSAAASIRADSETGIAQLLESPEDSEEGDGGDERRNASLDRLGELLARLDRVRAPVEAVKHLTTLMWLVADSASKKSEWRRALDAVVSTLDADGADCEDYENAVDVVRKLRDQIASSEPSAIARHREVHRAADCLVRSHAQATGFGLESEDERKQYRKYVSALEDVEVELQSVTKPRLTQQLVRDMYNYVGLRTEQAKLLGYESVCEMAMANVGTSRIATVDQIKSLHDSVSERVLPLIAEMNKTSSSMKTSPVDDLMAPAGPTVSHAGGSGVPLLDPVRRDEREMIRLEHHVTLDGALQFAFVLMKDLLGIQIVEEDIEGDGAILAWDRDVRLFRVYDGHSSDYLGSFYLDPFARAEKLDRPVTAPVFSVRGERQQQEPTAASAASYPVVCVSLTAQPPAWDTEPARLGWADTEALLHELAHAVDYLVSSSRLPFQSIAGYNTLPFDRSELLPKV